ncbi:hypothetical protein FACS1894218_0990 [Bacilli bacterium]|nr:hypothetical protein FACS1894218_0990 [Bacilli bacterium]
MCYCTQKIYRYMKNRKISKKKSLDSNGKKRKILLATLIPIGVVGITLGTALPLYFCFPGKKDLPEFSIINPLGDHFVLGYPTETQTLSVDPPISEGTIIAYNL